jgi:hypothetical protein
VIKKFLKVSSHVGWFYWLRESLDKKRRLEKVVTLFLLFLGFS